MHSYKNGLAGHIEQSVLIDFVTYPTAVVYDELSKLYVRFQFASLWLSYGELISFQDKI